MRYARLRLDVTVEDVPPFGQGTMPVATELTEDLVNLQRRSLEEEAKAKTVPYSAEAWAPWMEAAQAVDAAITQHAKETDQNRLDVATAVRRAAREAMGPPVPGVGSDG